MEDILRYLDNLIEEEEVEEGEEPKHLPVEDRVKNYYPGDFKVLLIDKGYETEADLLPPGPETFGGDMSELVRQLSVFRREFIENVRFRFRSYILWLAAAARIEVYEPTPKGRIVVGGADQAHQWQQQLNADMIEWLTHVAEGVIEIENAHSGHRKEWAEFHREWADGLLASVIDLYTTPTATPREIPEDFNLLYAIGEDDVEFDYWNYLVNANIDIYSDEAGDYADAIMCALYMELDGRVDEFEPDDPAHYPYGITQRPDYELWRQAPMSSQYGTPSSYDTDLLRDSNNAAIEETIEEFVGKAGPWEGWLNDQWEESSSGWFIKAWYSEPADEGPLGTPYAIMYYGFAELESALEAYPILDEDDHSEREWKATAENVEEEGQRHLADDPPPWWEPSAEWPPENWVGDLIEGFSEVGREEELYAQDEGGGYPSEEGTREILYELGYLDPDDAENYFGHRYHPKFGIPDDFDPDVDELPVGHGTHPAQERLPGVNPRF